jgi:hypothetical protein
MNKKGVGKVIQEEVKVGNIDKEINMIKKNTWEFVIGKK